MNQPIKKKWYTAKFRRQKPKAVSANTGSKQFFVTSQAEANESLRNELMAKYPDEIITVTSG